MLFNLKKKLQSKYGSGIRAQFPFWSMNNKPRVNGTKEIVIYKFKYILIQYFIKIQSF